MIESYKGRKIRPLDDIWVYRNLMRTDGPWYSIMQRGLVIAHATSVSLWDVRFVVREAGRQRVLATRTKNVHAFVVGRLNALGPAAHPFGPPEVLARRAGYNPYHAPAFIDMSGGDGSGNRLMRARAANLGPAGLTVWL